MRFMILVAFAASSLAVYPQRAQAGFYTGNEIYAACQADRSDVTYYQKSSKCMAYIAGAFDTLVLMKLSEGNKDCTPGNVTAGQLRDVVVKWMRDHPESRDRSAAVIVALSTMDAWPCPK